MKRWFSRTAKKMVSARAPDSAVPASMVLTAAQKLIAEGQKFEDEGEVEAALRCYGDAIAMQPTLSSGWLNQGNAEQLQGRIPNAVESYRQALALDIESAGAWLNLGNALLKLPANTQEARKAAILEAETSYRAALTIRPSWAEAWFGLGCALEVNSAAEEACIAYKTAIEIEPDHEGARFNFSDLTADSLVKSRQIGRARQVLLEALTRSPGQRRLLARLAEIERESGRLPEALDHFRHLVREQPRDFSVRSVFLFTLNYQLELSARDLYEEHRHFGELMEQEIIPTQPAVLRRGSRRLRIGYVSPDFRQHAVAVFMIPVLRNHDHSRVEIYCYHCHSGQDEITEVIRGFSDGWRDIAKLSDDVVAKQIVEDQIDVLIDLAGHTSGGRLSLFARKPAPVQITWLGYLGTTGLSRMDYRLCDFHTDPLGHAEARHTEKLLRMPASQWCYEPQKLVPAPASLPYLNRGYWTFGSYNNALKLNPEMLAAWAAVLRQFPKSRLKIFSIENDEIDHWIRVSLAKHNVTTDRVDLIGRIPMDEYFASARDVDIALDSFPYTGGTTTCDTLMMGLPVATIAGERTLERSGVSLLSTLGLEDWIASSIKELPALLRRQLADPEKIAALRAALPGRMRASALMDAPRFVADLEDHFHAAWQHWLASS